MSLPRGWRSAQLKVLCIPVPNTDPTRKPRKRFEYVDIGSIDNVRGRVGQTKRFLGRDAPTRARRPIQGGDVLFSNVRTYLRNVARVSEEATARLCSTGFTVLRPNGSLNSAYLYHYVRSDDFIASVTPKQTGTHYPATSDRIVLDQSIPVPPSTKEQEVIGKRLDHIAARLDSSRHRLDSVQTILRRFRVSVLAAACAGRLTLHWRSRNRSRSVLEGPQIDQQIDMPELPASWRYVRLGALALGLKYGTAKRCTHDGAGHPVLRIPNIGEGELLSTGMKYGDLPEREYRKLTLEMGDLLLIRSNGSVSLVGKAALVSREFRGFAYAGYLIRVRPDKKQILPEYLNYALASSAIRLQIEMQARSTSGVHNINSEEVRNLVVPLPPLEEQSEIAERVAVMLQQAKGIEQRYQRAKKLVSKLMPSVLEKAYRGELIIEKRT